MRNQIVAGNWKMNNDSSQTEQLIKDLGVQTLNHSVQVYIAPSFTQLSQAVNQLKGTPIKVAAQNMNAAASGAHTGEISASMLQGVGVSTVILGHSERRSLYSETDEILKEKVSTALEAGMEVIFCFGEELAQRKENNHFKIVRNQLSILFDLLDEAWK